MCHVLNIDYGILLGSTCMQGEEERENKALMAWTPPSLRLPRSFPLAKTEEESGTPGQDGESGGATE